MLTILIYSMDSQHLLHYLILSFGDMAMYPLLLHLMRPLLLHLMWPLLLHLIFEGAYTEFWFNIGLVCRLIMNRVFADYGVFHFTSPSLIARQRHGSSSSIEAEDLRISSVIVDEQRGETAEQILLHYFDTFSWRVTSHCSDSLLISKWLWKFSLVLATHDILCRNFFICNIIFQPNPLV